MTRSLSRSQVTIDVTARVVLETPNEIHSRCRNGCLAVCCEIREWDRRGVWIHSPIHEFPERLLHGSDFDGGLVLDVAFSARVSRREMNEDLLGRDEVSAYVWLYDLTGKRRREIDRTASGRVRVP